MKRKYEKIKWTQAQLIGHMLENDWKPLPSPGLWIHKITGHEVNLDVVMKDGRYYWHQLAERQALPPSRPVPF